MIGVGQRRLLPLPLRLRGAPVRPTRELDACGIGFVADAHGRPSRSIVAAALEGLAGVVHRGAVAADAASADGAGLLLPLSPALFGEANGVASLFVRGDDPRPAVEAAAAAEGVTVVGWRVPETDDGVLGERARCSRPGMVQVLFDRGSARHADERVAYRL